MGHSGVVVVVLTEGGYSGRRCRHCCSFDPLEPATACGHAIIGATGLAITRGVLSPRSHGIVRYDTRRWQTDRDDHRAGGERGGAGSLHGARRHGAAAEYAGEHRPSRAARRS